MTAYDNPFSSGAAEQLRDANQFATAFGAGALDMLPPDKIWDRLVILRSSPGAGKTSLMRLFTPDHLDWVRRRMKAEPVYEQLLGLKAFDGLGVRKLGLHIDLDLDYRALLDLPFGEDFSRKVFFRLLDVRILLGIVRLALQVNGLTIETGASSVRFVPSSSGGRAEILLDRMHGPGGDGVLAYARETEAQIMGLLDAVHGSELDDPPEGHSELYSLEVLSSSAITVDGVALDAQPLLMFDDGHRLDRIQRDALLGQIRRRRPTVARWYAERFEALTNQELLADVGEEGRDVELLNLDHLARVGSSDGRRFTRGRHDRVLTDIARRRAAPALSLYASESKDFLSLLEDDPMLALNDRVQPAYVDIIRSRTELKAAGQNKYTSWLQDALQMSAFEAAVRWRELDILIERDLDRQPDLFGEPLTADDFTSRTSAALREAAALSVASDASLPYYSGVNNTVKVGSHNARQFISICADLFADMLVDISLGRPPLLNLERQHRVITKASDAFWHAIPRTVPNGRDVQLFVNQIVRIFKEENAKPTVPYPPGVTGTALLMSERRLLLDDNYRATTPGADRLFGALGSAVAHNIVQADLNYSVKGNSYMVLYLNRLLCPRFGMPLNFGGFRERKLTVMSSWFQDQLSGHSGNDQVTLPL